MIVIVTGGRDYAGPGLVEALDRLHAERGIVELITGDATGADTIAAEWARARGVHFAQHVAHWSRGRRAGPIRNAEIVGHALLHAAPDMDVICLAALGGFGTADCVRRCRKAGIEVREVTT